MYKINKTFTFDSAHSLDHLQEGHKCKNLHGHTYQATFYFKSLKLNKNGFIIDFNDTKIIKDFIDQYLDHKNLNEVLPIATTSENICYWLYQIFKPYFKQLYSVSIKETPTSFACYEE